MKLLTPAFAFLALSFNVYAAPGAKPGSDKLRIKPSKGKLSTHNSRHKKSEYHAEKKCLDAISPIYVGGAGLPYTRFDTKTGVLILKNNLKTTVVTPSGSITIGNPPPLKCDDKEHKTTTHDFITKELEKIFRQAQSDHQKTKSKYDLKRITKTCRSVPHINVRKTVTKLRNFLSNNTIDKNSNVNSLDNN